MVSDATEAALRAEMEVGRISKASRGGVEAGQELAAMRQESPSLPQIDGATAQKVEAEQARAKELAELRRVLAERSASQLTKAADEVMEIAPEIVSKAQTASLALGAWLLRPK